MAVTPGAAQDASGAQNPAYRRASHFSFLRVVERGGGSYDFAIQRITALVRLAVLQHCLRRCALFRARLQSLTQEIDPMQTREIVLARRPYGKARAEDFSVQFRELAPLQAG